MTWASRDEVVIVRRKLEWLHRGGQDHADALSRPAVDAAIIWMVGVVLWITWAPFSLRDVPVMPGSVRVPGTADGLGNFLLLVPLGILVALRGATRGSRVSLHRVAIVAGLFSLGVEIGQLFIDGRVVSPIDVLLNAVGAVAGALVVDRLLVRGARAGAVFGWVIGGVFIAVSAHVVLGAIGARQSFRLMSWDASFPIVASDEVSGDRTYRGDVREAVLCAGPAQDEVCAAPGASLAVRQQVAERAVEAQRFVLSAEVASASDAQLGPARILTFSPGVSARNVTIGQEGRALVLRIRTPLGGANGTGFELRLPNAVRAGEMTHVRAIFDGGAVRMEARGARSVAGSFEFGPLEGWLISRSLSRVVPRDFVVARAIAIFVLLGPVVIGLLMLRRTAPSGGP